MGKKTKSPPAPSEQPSPRKDTSSPRGLMPYIIGAILAACVMGWYFFAYVPAHIEYFLGLRFRTLAVAAGQIKSKTESLAAALRLASRGIQSDDLQKEAEKYLRVLIPEIHLGRGDAPDGLDLKGEYLSGRVAWADLVTQVAAASRRDFSDLLLADSKGRVVWQRESSTPRIAQLSELLNAPAEPDGWFPFSLRWNMQTTALKASKDLSIPQTATLKLVNLNGTSSILFVQGIGLSTDAVSGLEPGEAELYVAGVVSRAVVPREAMHISTAWIVLFTLPVVLLFLALPFVKLGTLTPKERYSFADVILLSVAPVLALAIAGVLPFLPASVTESGDQRLSEFAGQINHGLRADTEAILNLAAAVSREPLRVEGALRDCAVTLKNDKGALNRRRCQLWEALGPDGTSGSIELDVIAWLDENGMQVEKWSTKEQVTARVSHVSFEHFQDLRAGRTWTLDNGRERFTIEPLRSPTTSDLAFTFALRTPDPPYPNSESRYMVLNVRPQSLVDTLVPPGYGFAVLAQDGRVLFHSEEGLSLVENFFEEVSSPEEVRSRVRAGRLERWSGEYHGRPHRFYMQPVEGFIGCPWRIVTFQELDPILSAQVAQQSGILRLLLLDLLAGLLAVLCAIGWWKLHDCEIRDKLMSFSSIDSKHPQASIRSVAILASLTVLSILTILFLDSSDSPTVLNVVFWFFFLLPLIVVPVVGLARKHAMRQLSTSSIPAPGRSQYLMLGAELGLAYLLIGGAPAAGFAHIVNRVQERQRTARWLEESQERWDARRARIQRRVLQTDQYSRETKEILENSPGFAAKLDQKSADDPRYSYLKILHEIHPAPGQASGTAEIGLIERVLSWMPKPLSYSSEEPKARTIAQVPGFQLLIPGQGEKPAMIATYLNRPDATFGDLFFSLLMVCTVFGAAYWARKKLAVLPPLQGTGFRYQMQNLPAGKNEGILVIGPPRMEKDKIVADIVQSETGHHPDLRIPLQDAKLTSDWVEKKLAEVERLVNTATTSRIWLHLSNLEAQLVSAESRTQVLRLVEKLLAGRAGQPGKVLIVTSTIDPISHFAEVFQQERREIYANEIPEVELNRSSLLLSRFRRCYVPIENRERGPWPFWLDYQPDKWDKTLEQEVAPYAPLLAIANELKTAWAGTTHVPMEDLVQAVRTRTEACYQLLWTSCTRQEKLVLIQLAQEGLVNPKCREILAELAAKGLVVQRPSPAIFNYTFRDFLRRIERNDVVQQWERMDGSGLWQVSARLVASILVAGGGFFLLTQGFSAQTLLPIVSGTGVFGVPLARDLLARVSGKGDAKVAAA